MAAHRDLIDQAVCLQKPVFRVFFFDPQVDIQLHQLQLEQICLLFFFAAHLSSCATAMDLHRDHSLIERSLDHNAAEIPAGVECCPVDRDPDCEDPRCLLPVLQGIVRNLKRSSREKSPLCSDHRSYEAGASLTDLQRNIDQILFLSSFLLPRGLCAHTVSSDTLTMCLQSSLGPAARKPALRPAGPCLCLEKKAFFHRFKQGFLFSAGRDQKLLHVLEVALLHGKAAVQRPVLFFCEDLLKTAAVEENCRPLKVRFRHREKIRLCPDLFR